MILVLDTECIEEILGKNCIEKLPLLDERGHIKSRFNKFTQEYKTRIYRCWGDSQILEYKLCVGKILA